MFRALRWLGTASILIFIFALPAQHLLENKAMAVPPFMNISGAVTLGTGSGASNGDVNVTDYNDDFGMAMNAALRRGRVVCVLPGNYTAKTAATIAASSVHVFGFGRPSVAVNAANVSTPAVFNIDSDNEVVIEGITFTRDVWVASQVLIDIAPATGTTALNHVVRDCVFTNSNITATGFSDGNEMLDILVTNGAGCEVTDNTFYPGIGVSNVKLVTGNMNIISGNKFRNTLNSGIAELPTTARRAVHRTIHLDNEEWTQIVNNYWWALGIAETNPPGVFDGYRVTNLIYYQGPTGGTEERGHLVIRGNTMAVCTTQTTAWIQIRGCDWAQIEGNFLCFNPLADTIGTGFIVIEGSSGKTGDDSTNITIQANHIHNPGGTSTRQCSAVYIRKATDVKVLANDFNELYCEQAVHVDSSVGTGAAVSRLSVLGNTFNWPATTPAITRVPILRNSNNSALADVHFGGNTVKQGTAHYSGTAPSGKAITNKGIWDTAGSAETASAISINVDF